MPDLAEIQKEWAVIIGAPWLTLSLAIFVLGVTWAFSTLMNKSAMASKNATIESLKTQVEDFKEKLKNVAAPKEESTEPNYAAWRHVEKFTIFQASYLWAGRQPKGGSLHPDALAWEEALCAGVRTGKLGFLPKTLRPWTL